MHWGSVAEWGMVVFAAATAYFAWTSSVSSKRVEFLVGAFESHSTMLLRMEAWDRKLKVIAYDPATARYPARVPRIGEEWPLDTVFLAVPPEFRNPSGR